MSEVLGRALEMLRGGWTSAPLSLDAGGKFCAPTDEGVTLFCVDDALDVAADDVDSLQNAEDALNRRLGFEGVRMHVNEWASERSRTHGDVLQLFTRTHRQALTKETRP